MATPASRCSCARPSSRRWAIPTTRSNRPIVGITNTYSDYNPCHGNVPQIIEAVKRGVMLAGAMPMVFPTISIAESFAFPTSMYLRNLMAMDTEEMIRAQPMDAVVVIGGCDKTLPAQIMAAVSADLPTVVIPVGPMVVGHHKGEVLGACTDCRRLWAKYRAGEIDDGRDRGRQRPARAIGRHLHGDGHRLHHGLRHRGAWPVAADERDDSRRRMPSAFVRPRRAAKWRRRWRRPRDRSRARFLTPASFRNAQVVMQAIGGSTNGLIHLTAIANRTAAQDRSRCLRQARPRGAGAGRLESRRASTTWSISIMPAACRN